MAQIPESLPRTLLQWAEISDGAMQEKHGNSQDLIAGR